MNAPLALLVLAPAYLIAVSPTAQDSSFSSAMLIQSQCTGAPLVVRKAGIRALTLDLAAPPGECLLSITIGDEVRELRLVRFADGLVTMAGPRRTAWAFRGGPSIDIGDQVTDDTMWHIFHHPEAYFETSN